MDARLISLFFVVIFFALLFYWTYRPSNRSRFEQLGRSILADDDAKGRPDLGGRHD